MTDNTHLLTDEQMQHFIVNGYINIKTDLPPDFHEGIFQQTEAVFEKEGNPREQPDTQNPGYSGNLRPSRCRWCFDRACRSKLLHAPTPPLPLQPAG